MFECLFCKAKEKLKQFANINLAVLPTQDVMEAIVKTGYDLHIQIYHTQSDVEIIKGESTKCAWLCISQLARNKKSNKAKELVSQYIG